MKILSKLPLWKLHEFNEFQQAKNDKLYELCFDEVKVDAQYHRDHWQNTIYAGPSYRGPETLSKKYRHFMVFLAECIALYRLTFKLTTFEPLNSQSGYASGNYTYLADQGMLGLCCRLYPEFLPPSGSSVAMTTFKQWTRDEEDYDDEDPSSIIGLARPCWKLNYDLIRYDRQLWQSTYPTLEFSIQICEFLGYDLHYLKLHLDRLKLGNDENLTLMYNLMDGWIDIENQSILPHRVCVLEFLKDVLHPTIKIGIKEFISKQFYELKTWAAENL